MIAPTQINMLTFLVVNFTLQGMLTWKCELGMLTRKRSAYHV